MPLIEDQNRLSELRSRRQTLLEQMGGRVPLPDPIYRTGEPRPVRGLEQLYRPGPTVLLPQQHLEELRRRKAELELLKQGATREQIQTVLETRRLAKPGFIESLKRDMGEDVGGIAGGIAGAKLGLALGQAGPQAATLLDELVLVPGLAAIGAAGLGGLGKITQQAISPYEDPEVDTFFNAAKRQGLYELGGRYFSALVRYSPLTKKPIKTPERIKRMFARKGGFFSPRQRDRRIFIRASEELSRGSFGGGAIFEGFDLKSQQQALDVATDVIDSIAGQAVKDPTTLGDELFEIFARKGERGIRKRGTRQILLKNFFDPLYKEVGRLSPGTTLPTEPIKKFMRDKLAEDLAQGGALLTSEGRSVFKRALRTLKPRRTISQFIDLRSSYLKDARKFAVGADKSESIFIELADVADEALFSPTLSMSTEEAFHFGRTKRAVQLFQKGPQYKQFVVREADILRKIRDGVITQAEGAQVLDDFATKLGLPSGVLERDIFGLTPEASKLLRNINAVYGPSKVMWEDVFTRSVISQLGTSPSNISKVVFKDFDYERLKGIRDILTSPVPKRIGKGKVATNVAEKFRELRRTLPNVRGGAEALESITKNAAEGRALWKQLNANWFAEQIKTAYNPTTKMLDVKKLDKAFGKIPPKTFKLMFPGSRGQAVKDVKQLFDILAPPRRGFVSMFGKTFELGGLTGIGAALGAGRGIGITTSGALMISPTAFAVLATNRKATKLLTLGLKSKLGAVKVAPIAARLINILQEDEAEDIRAIEKERTSKRRQIRRQKEREFGVQRFLR